MGSPDPVVQGKPSWLKVRLPAGREYLATRKVARDRKLSTVCEDALCPNVADCWGRRTATFMILGNICTRSCGFCAVKTGYPDPVDPSEPLRTALAVRDLGIRHAVITSVDRDDLDDGGAGIYAETILRIREHCPGTRVEVLTPDFQGDPAALGKVWEARPDVHGHNLECVPRLQKRVRRRATYACSLEVLRATKKLGLLTKTGLQVGHGETRDELLGVFDDLARIGVGILTLGQYLRPTQRNLPVERYYAPEEFAALRDEAMARGIRWVQSGPLVRSSYRAEAPFEPEA